MARRDFSFSKFRLYKDKGLGNASRRDLARVSCSKPQKVFPQPKKCRKFCAFWEFFSRVSSSRCARKFSTVSRLCGVVVFRVCEFLKYFRSTRRDCSPESEECRSDQLLAAVQVSGQRQGVPEAVEESPEHRTGQHFREDRQERQRQVGSPTFRGQEVRVVFDSTDKNKLKEVFALTRTVDSCFPLSTLFSS
jgi:uncharacterized protein (DUF3084 family)